MTNGDKIKLRAELARKYAAAMVSAITNEDDYTRVYYLAQEQGIKVSQWIARDSVKQDDAVMQELGLSLDRED